MTFSFDKYVGAGNDFIFVNALDFPEKNQRPAVAKKVCDRKWGIGADGLVFFSVLDKEKGRFQWDFYNNDGSNAEMCGNAARCAIVYCLEKFGSQSSTIESAIGLLSGHVVSEGAAISWSLKSTTLEKKSLILENNKVVEGFFVNTGVPHFVVLQGEQPLNGRDCLLIQDHTEFQPQQTNVTLLEVKKDGENLTKSFERGVRNFTLACGTGVIASALVLKEIQSQETYRLTAPGGKLSVVFNDSDATLIGPAEKTFSGQSTWQRN